MMSDVKLEKIILQFILKSDFQITQEHKKTRPKKKSLKCEKQ